MHVQQVKTTQDQKSSLAMQACRRFLSMSRMADPVRIMRYLISRPPLAPNALPWNDKGPKICEPAYRVAFRFVNMTLFPAYGQDQLPTYEISMVTSRRRQVHAVCSARPAADAWALGRCRRARGPFLLASFLVVRGDA